MSPPDESPEATSRVVELRSATHELTGEAATDRLTLLHDERTCSFSLFGDKTLGFGRGCRVGERGCDRE